MSGFSNDRLEHASIVALDHWGRQTAARSECLMKIPRRSSRKHDAKSNNGQIHECPTQKKIEFRATGE
jgi:hypothetical protein